MWPFGKNKRNNQPKTVRAEMPVDKTPFMRVTIGKDLYEAERQGIANKILARYPEYRIAVDTTGQDDGSISVEEHYPSGTTREDAFLTANVQVIVQRYMFDRLNRSIVFNCPTVSACEALEAEDIWLAGCKVTGALPLGPDSFGVTYKLDGEFTLAEKSSIEKRSGTIARAIKVGTFPPLRWIILPEGREKEAKLVCGILTRWGIKKVGVSSIESCRSSEPFMVGMSPELEATCFDALDLVKRLKIPLDCQVVLLGSGYKQQNSLLKAGIRARAVPMACDKTCDPVYLDDCDEVRRKVELLLTQRECPVEAVDFSFSLVEPVKGKRKRIKELERQVDTLQDLLDSANEKLRLVQVAAQ